MAYSPRFVSKLFLLFALGISLSFALKPVRALPQSGTAAADVEGSRTKPEPDDRNCDEIRERKEWRQLSVKERLDYLSAVKCLMAAPPSESGSTRPGVRSRYDEFQSSHIDLTPSIHRVGQFLPWHRYFVTLFFNALTEECGYKGPGVYWDWTIDSDGPGLMKDSPIFDPDTGFGGDGTPGTYVMPLDANPSFVPGRAGCVKTGPFTAPNLLNFGVGPTTIAEHCLVRLIGESMRMGTTSEVLRITMSRTPFEKFRTTLESGDGEVGIGLHTGGHGIVGGEMWNFYSSPGDPIFYLHHANLDRIWDMWQKVDPENRMYDISGNAVQNITPATANVTLDFMMPFTTLSRPIAIREVMEIGLKPNCFRYID